MFYFILYYIKYCLFIPTERQRHHSAPECTHRQTIKRVFCVILNFNIFLYYYYKSTNRTYSQRTSTPLFLFEVELKEDKIAKKSEQSEANKDKNIIIIEMQKKVYIKKCV